MHPAISWSFVCWTSLTALPVCCWGQLGATGHPMENCIWHPPGRYLYWACPEAPPAASANECSCCISSNIEQMPGTSTSLFSFCQIQSDSRPSPPSLGCGGKLSSSLMLLGILWGFVVNKLYRHNVFGGDLVVLGCPHSVLQTSSVCPQCIPVPEKANLVTDTSGNFLLTRLRFIQGCNGNNADSN